MHEEVGVLGRPHDAVQVDGHAADEDVVHPFGRQRREELHERRTLHAHPCGRSSGKRMTSRIEGTSA
ncbi:MAG: hypothetical protein ACNA8N_09060, partial [Trueperaceae bacterium]